MIQEGRAKIDWQIPDKISKDMEVFYNPVMKVNRDFSIMILNELGFQGMRIADPLAGSGIRSIRFALELGFDAEIYSNDIREAAAEDIRKNAKVNGTEISVFNEDANVFLMKNGPWDYIDVDPFGPPNKFLNSAIRSIFDKGILAVTATDTSCLSGTYPNACKRKYWARPLRTGVMHEVGIRILIRKVQLVGSQFEKAAIPIYSFSTDHYLRVFFRVYSSRKETDKMMKYHQLLISCPCKNRLSDDVFNDKKCPCCGKDMQWAGPLWAGELWDQDLSSKILGISPETKKIADTIRDESLINQPFFYDIHRIWKHLNLKRHKKMDEIISAIRESGKKASRTHFSRYGIRTDYENILDIL